MKEVTVEDIKKLHIPSSDSHKGQNGRILIIGGSHLFHAASLWSLTVASRIVDLVHYASVPENNELVAKAKEEFRNGIVIPREDIEEYIHEDDVILIGPGMMRSVEEEEDRRQMTERWEDDKTGRQEDRGQKTEGWEDRKTIRQEDRGQIEDILRIEDEGVQTGALTNYLLAKYPNKQWVIDAGALQMIDVTHIPKNAILTPHHGEFELLLAKSKKQKAKNIETSVQDFAETYQCIVLHKGVEDIASNGVTGEVRRICGGNAGMTKGGTGDVLAGLIGALACANDPWTATIAGSFINKQAGDALYETVGPFFNATDLALEIPKTMKRLVLPE